MAVSIGINSWVGFGRQVTLGTTVARTRFIDFVREDIKKTPELVRLASLGTRSHRTLVEQSTRSGGTFMVEGNYEGMEVLFKDALGTAAAPVVVGATTAYNTVFTLASTPPSPGLTVEINRGLVSGFTYEGCKIDKLRLLQNADRILEVEVTIVGRGETLAAATVSPTFPSLLPIAGSHLAIVVGGVSLFVESFEITIDNMLAGDRRQTGAMVVKEPVVNDKRVVSGQMTIDFESLVEYNRFVNQTEQAMTATWTGGVIDGAENNRLVISCPKTRYTGETPNVRAPGPITFNASFQAFEQTRNAQDELTVTLENTLSTAVI